MSNGKPSTSIRQAAVIGALWGVGHTLTISLVGSAIILFGLVIPPRIGLSMEFSVAVMLILLGVLNLSGVIQWLTKKFTPQEKSSEASATQNNSTGVAAKLPNGMVSRYGL